jgi:hypothetical protein
MNATTKIAVDPEIWTLEAEELFAPCAALIVGAGPSEEVAGSVAIATGPTEGAGPVFAMSRSVKNKMHFINFRNI